MKAKGSNYRVNTKWVININVIVLWSFEYSWEYKLHKVQGVTIIKTMPI